MPSSSFMRGDRWPWPLRASHSQCPSLAAWNARTARCCSAARAACEARRSPCSRALRRLRNSVIASADAANAPTSQACSTQSAIAARASRVTTTISGKRCSRWAATSHGRPSAPCATRGRSGCGSAHRLPTAAAVSGRPAPPPGSPDNSAPSRRYTHRRVSRVGAIRAKSPSSRSAVACSTTRPRRAPVASRQSSATSMVPATGVPRSRPAAPLRAGSKDPGGSDGVGAGTAVAWAPARRRPSASSTVSAW